LRLVRPGTHIGAVLEVEKDSMSFPNLCSGSLL
jgi:hypothetical protein